ncbi:MAG: sel1 repeat family protein [Polyangiaceae bacterium]|nr:sel1 repeat family protein [Polyangiaceae bacterium]
MMLDVGAGAPRDIARAATLLQQACDAGEGSACSTLATNKRLRGAPGADVAELARKGCDAGSGRGCSDLATMIRVGRDVPTDAIKAESLDGRALELARAACDAGSCAECRYLAYLLDDGRGEPVDAARAEAIRAAQVIATRKACEQGDLLACNEAANDVAFARLPLAPPSAEDDTFLRATCKRDVLEACEELAFYLPDDEARPFREQACRLRDAHHCRSLSTPEGSTKAEDIWERDCEVGEVNACVQTLALLEEAKAPPEVVLPRAARTRRLASQACRAGGFGCSIAAKLAAEGRGGPKDETAAIELLSIRCRDGMCRELANQLLQSSDPTSKERGLALLEANCDKGEGCDDLAKIYDEGTLVPKNAKRARDLYLRALRGLEKACDNNDALACSLAGYMYFEGQGVRANALKARALYTKSCNLGERSSCDFIELTR